ncbi:MAG: hypothetical protein ACI8X5_000028 [Planctomycetota bacterium]|jgi:hypothetical protein
MAPARRNSNSTGMNPFLAGLLILVAIVGALVTLEATGTTDLGLKKLWNDEPVMAGNLMPVIISAMPFEPGERITLGKVWNNEVGTFNHKFMDKNLVAERAYVALPQDLIGRVLARPKSPNQVFVESDLLPKGSPSGIVGLIPTDMVSLSIETKRVKGIDLLGFGDHFDLRAMVEADESVRVMAEKVLQNRTYSSEADRLRLATIAEGPSQRTLVQSGIVIRQPKGKNDSLIVAIHPDDVNGAISALSSGIDIYCTASTGQPGVEVERVEKKTIDPMAEYLWVLESSKEVQIFQGNESTRAIVPTAPSEEVAPTAPVQEAATEGGQGTTQDNK